MKFDFLSAKLRMVFGVTEEGKAFLHHFGCNNANEEIEKNARWCNPCDIQLAGGNPDDHHGAKHTGTCGSESLKYQSHTIFDTVDGKQLDLVLCDSQIKVTLHYRIYDGLSVVRCWTTVENISSQIIGLEYISSFCYYGFDNGCAVPDESIKIYLPHNTWKRENNWKVYTPADLGLDRTTSFSMKRISVSNNGTWSSKEFLPMGAVENITTQNVFLWQIEHNGSWQWEISDLAEKLYLKISGPNEQENHWYKELKTGEFFNSVPISIAVGESFDEALENMTYYRRVLFKCNTELPIIFNDYMNCLWAEPTEEKMIPVIDRAAETGAEYYCMDAGWYADGTWWETVGEWQPCEWRFPNGIKYIFDYIRSKGMVPGIWLEIEVMGINCPLAAEFEDECFFMRHGKRVIDHGRYILDFRNGRVRKFTRSVVDRVVQEYGVGYIKFDYNVDGGIGTEVDADSYGDGLYGHNVALLSWLREICEAYPNLIIENCASGGLRADYASLSISQIHSVSDQPEYNKMAQISAGAGTSVLPEQAAIWAYPLASDSEKTVIFNMANALLQRIHLSGEITGWNDTQMKLVKEAVDCYKSLRDDIPQAIPFYPLGLPDVRNGWLCMAHRFEGKIRMTVWRMNSEENICDIPIAEKVTDMKVIYPSEYAKRALLTDNGVRVELLECLSAIVLEIIL